mgnify:CR=1 FL=1|tara:strand:- start:13446 stop:14774 length:1329 start_codon:yes stop_codon:yes gene_type:complete
MILYIIKSGLCLVVILGIYLVLLEREKMHQFNRFFLLFSLVFGLSIPLISLNLDFTQSYSATSEFLLAPVDYISDTFVVNHTLDNALPSSVTSLSSFLTMSTAALLVYGFVVLILAFRFFRSLFAMRALVKTSERVKKGRAHFVLVEEDVVPHSFLIFIFLNKKKYATGLIEQEIINHEIIHSKEWHSLDVLLIEILKIVFWFNPVFNFYKKVIQLNHEFLADSSVADKSTNLQFYQQLLLKYSSHASTLSLTSNFNYSLTKKRLVMMTKKSTRKQIWLRKACTLPILLMSVLLFSASIDAQDVKQASVSELVNELTSKISNGKSLSQAEKQELGSLLVQLTKVIPPPPPHADETTKPEKVYYQMLEAEEALAMEKFRTNTVAYMSMTFAKNSEKEINEAYKKVKASYDEYYQAQKKNAKGSVLPPLPANPEFRKALEKKKS